MPSVTQSSLLSPLQSMRAMLEGWNFVPSPQGKLLGVPRKQKPNRHTGSLMSTVPSPLQSPGSWFLQPRQQAPGE